ncbi:MAG: hypothetical protein IT324_23190 [Anaerolineae bacterium]|nr:hypothetical protein [Anaerolineae bacterium]
MTRSLNRLTLAILIGFAAVAISQLYWSVFASDSMLARGDNPRRVEAERAIKRGTIYDRNGLVLAQSVQTGVAPSGKPVMRREYLHPEAVSVIGYYSLIYGVGGVEAAFDKTLRGDDRRDAGIAAVDEMLHRQQVGSDVRLTLDSRLQAALATALKDRHGAAIVIDVPSGAVLGMISVPTFDPNTLNTSFNAMLNDPAAPLLNRVTQGIYQPGGALQTVILTSMLTNKIKLDAPVTNGDAPIQIKGLTLTCAASGLAATIGSAYALACPAPFADAMTGQPGAGEIRKTISAFGLLQPPTLVGFDTVSGEPAIPLTSITDPDRLHAEGIGQGGLTVTPLQMALIAATIANRGNTVTPYLADATRPPNAAIWQPLQLPTTQNAVITLDVTDSLRTAMLEAATNGAAKAAARPGVTIYGHASTAYTGQSANAWFIGFIDLPNRRSIAVAVVIEDTSDASLAAEVGGLALTEAAR